MSRINGNGCLIFVFKPSLQFDLFHDPEVLKGGV